MKKLLTTLLICILSVISIFAFTACDDEAQKGNEGGSGNNTEQDGDVRYTVTEEEWKEALSLFDIYDEHHEIDKDKIENKKEKLNFKITRAFEETGGEESYSGKYIFEADYLKKVFMLSYSGVFNGEAEEFKNYSWKGNDGIFMVDFENLELQYITDGKFNDYFGDYLFEMAGFIIEYYGNFADFRYDKDKKSYSEVVDDEDDNSNFTLKFGNGKLVEIYIEDVEEESSLKQTFTIEYGVTVTIPDEILNMAK